MSTATTTKPVLVAHCELVAGDIITNSAGDHIAVVAEVVSETRHMREFVKCGRTLGVSFHPAALCWMAPRT